MASPKRSTQEEKHVPEAPEAAAPASLPMAGGVECEKRAADADRLIREHIGWSCAGGLIPVPLLDIAAITATQIKLVQGLSALYGVPFKENLGRNIIASLIGGVGSAAVGRGIFCSVLKAVPVVGTLGGLVSVPIVAGASTYALGKVFVEHFESGGTMLDFDPKPMRAFFEAKFKEGQKIARETWEKTSRAVSR